MITPMVMEAVEAQPEDVAALDVRIKATVEHLRDLIDERDRLTAKYVLRPVRIGEVL